MTPGLRSAMAAIPDNRPANRLLHVSRSALSTFAAFAHGPYKPCCSALSATMGDASSHIRHERIDDAFVDEARNTVVRATHREQAAALQLFARMAMRESRSGVTRGWRRGYRRRTHPAPRKGGHAGSVHVGSSPRALLRRSLPDAVLGNVPAGNNRT